MALYRTYRPKRFNQLLGQEPIVRILRNAIARDQLSHAYLFTGPRGTGKTTTARIFAQAMNCTNFDAEKQEPCGQCQSCLLLEKGESFDLIEIDAATHTQVDHIRELNEKIQFRPNQLRYKVYIIDEVHMLSKGAFNALLKTLEEPPEHVVFILATTEVQQIPITILSRCQRFDFQLLSPAQLSPHLVYVAQREGVELQTDAAELLALLSHGGVRDGLSLLEKVLGYQEKVATAELVRSVLGLPSEELMVGLFDQLAQHQLDQMYEQLRQLQSQGIQLAELLERLANYAKNLLVFQKIGKSEVGGQLLIQNRWLQQFQTQAQTFTGESLIQLAQAALKLKATVKDQQDLQLLLELTLMEIFGATNISPATQPVTIAAANNSLIQTQESAKFEAPQEATSSTPQPESQPKVKAAQKIENPQEVESVIEKNHPSISSDEGSFADDDFASLVQSQPGIVPQQPVESSSSLPSETSEEASRETERKEIITSPKDGNQTERNQVSSLPSDSDTQENSTDQIAQATLQSTESEDVSPATSQPPADLFSFLDETENFEPPADLFDLNAPSESSSVQPDFKEDKPVQKKSIESFEPEAQEEQVTITELDSTQLPAYRAHLIEQVKAQQEKLAFYLEAADLQLGAQRHQLMLSFKHTFHKDMVDRSSNHSLIQNILRQQLGNHIQLSTQLQTAELAPFESPTESPHANEPIPPSQSSAPSPVPQPQIEPQPPNSTAFPMTVEQATELVLEKLGGEVIEE